MDEIQQRLQHAAGHFYHLFLESWLYTSGELERQDFTFSRQSSGAGLNGSPKEGTLYAASQIVLRRYDGSKYEWRVGMIYEVGDCYQQGCGYSYASVCPNEEKMFVPLYSVGDVQLFERYGELREKVVLTGQDWLIFCDGMEQLAEKCLADMEFIFRNNLTKKLYEMSLQEIDASQPNPFLTAEIQL